MKRHGESVTRFEYAADAKVVRVHYEVKSSGTGKLIRSGNIKVVERNSDLNTKDAAWSYLRLLGLKQNDPGYTVTMRIEKKGGESNAINPTA